MSIRIVSLLFIGLFIHHSSWAISPKVDFIKKESFGSVSNYRHLKADVDLSIMDSEFEYADLNQANIQELESLFEVKKEYGKMFGFKEWTPTEKKFVEVNSNRIFVIQGHYKDSENKIVHFLEVYWADNKKSGQYLITSNSKHLKIENYKEYLNL